jgi:hypothetical protein
MAKMLLVDSRKTIHIGINLVMTHIPQIDTRLSRKFQALLDEAGVEYTNVAVSPEGNELSIGGKQPGGLQIKLAHLNPLVGQLLVIASFPEGTVTEFGTEAERIVRAFEELAPSSYRQLVAKDATIRDLYNTAGAHAFQLLWEELLGQQSGRLKHLDHAVLGGGLRFVMPPMENEPDPVSIELKIESYLNDASKMFIECQASWPKPAQAGELIDPVGALTTVDNYIKETAIDFIERGSHDSNDDE